MNTPSLQRSRAPFTAGLAGFLLTLTLAPAHGQGKPAPRLPLAEGEIRSVLASVEARRNADSATALAIWKFAEVGYQEQQSSALLQEEMKGAGFKVTAGVADIPTAFVAEYTQGPAVGTAGAGPVLGFLGEFDALPGVSQAALPERTPLKGRISGHACGHHLFGAGSASAAIATAQWLKSAGRAGTVRFYGTPAEEGGAGKVYMARAGLFKDVDVVLHWHPSDGNNATQDTSLANKSAKFRFRGTPSHAAGAPDRGRSALDGVEAMNYMVNLMREHIPSDARIHYIITNGGAAPNVVPESAEVFYYVRHPNAAVMQGLFDRVVKAAEAGALGTGTKMEFEVIHGAHSLLPIDSLGAVADAMLRRVGGVRYTAEERAFAEKLSVSLGTAAKPPGSEMLILPYGTNRGGYGSTDVGDISWLVPTVGIRTATWVPGTSAHSWQAIAAGGMTIGTKGMENAAKTLALTAVALFRDPKLIEAARQEFEQKRGAGFQYQSIVGDRKPPLDYRN
jgi:aminobenzoyl-glutamate utilization protein B